MSLIKRLAVTGLGLGVGSTALAGAPPIVGPEMRVDTGAGNKSTNETSCASLAAYPGEIIATFNDYRQNQWRCGVGVSVDGETWTDFLVRPPKNNQAATEGDPMTAYDNRTNTLWVGAIAFAQNGGLFVAKKKPGENEFEAAVMARKDGTADKCWMAAGPAPGDTEATSLYIAYSAGVISSTDMGSTWSGVTSLGSGLGFIPRVAPDGTLYVAYWNTGSNFTIRRSTNGGGSFTSGKTIAKRTGSWGIYDGPFPGSFRVAPLCCIAVDPVDSATVYAVFPDNGKTGGGNTKVGVYFTKSADSGDTWSKPVMISGAQDNIKADAFFPWIETDRRGRIHVYWFDTRNKEQNDRDSKAFIDTYYAYSDDGGAAWGELRVTSNYWDSEKGTNGFIGDYLGAAPAGRRIHLCYPTTAGQDLDTYVTTITDPRADMNCDDALDFGDIDPFVTALISRSEYEAQYPGCDYARGDLNNDDLVDFGDIDRFVEFLTE